MDYKSTMDRIHDDWMLLTSLRILINHVFGTVKYPNDPNTKFFNCVNM